MNDEAIVNKIKEHLRERVAELANPAPRRIFLKVEQANLISTMQFLKENLGFTYVATITGLDRGEVFEILYHLANEFTCLTVRTTTPRSEPRVPTVTGVLPGAILYERELQDMFGMVIENIPDPRPLVLPDDWPKGVYPLRKDWHFERPPEKIPGGGA